MEILKYIVGGEDSKLRIGKFCSIGLNVNIYLGGENIGLIQFQLILLIIF